MWINWIKTQSFVPGKLSSCGNNLHPSTAVLIFSHTLSACGCRLRFTKAGHGCICRTLAQIHLRVIFSRGTDPSLQWNPQNLFCTPPGHSLGILCHQSRLSKAFPEPEEIHVLHKVLREEESTKGGSKSPTLLTNKYFYLCLCTLYKSCTNSQQEGCKSRNWVK